MKIVSIGNDTAFHKWCAALNLKPEIDAFYVPPNEPHRAHAINEAIEKKKFSTEAEIVCDDKHAYSPDERAKLLAATTS